MAGTLSSLNRLRQIVQTFARHGLGGMVDQLGLADGTLAQKPAAAHRMAARFGRRLSLALNDLGPTFVKFGQILATREDIVPRAAAQELSQLCDSSRPLPTKVVRSHVEKALGRSIGDVFESFSEKPLATGSIAQVHAARTNTGADVVVKVRRPKIERIIERDLDVLHTAAELAAARMPEIARHDPVGFVDEFGRSLRAELDFREEAATLAKMRAWLGKTAHVPEPFPEWSTDSVLTQERLHGVQVGHVEDPDARASAALKMVACFATQFIKSGTFHADPHAGNILMLEDGRLGLLDFGSVGTLTPEVRNSLLRISSSAARRDGRQVAEQMLAAVHVPDDLEMEAYVTEMGGVTEALMRQQVGSTTAAAAMQKLFAVTRNHGLRLRAEYFLLFRSIMLLDGVLRSLDSSIDPVVATKTYISRSLFTRTWFTTAVRMSFGAARRRLLQPASKRTEATDDKATTKKRRRRARKADKTQRSGGRLARSLGAARQAWLSRRQAARDRRLKARKKKRARRGDGTSRRYKHAAAAVLLLAAGATVGLAELELRGLQTMLRRLGDTAEPQAPAPVPARVVHGCPLRAKPNKKSTRVGSLGTGAEVQILDGTRYFWMIRTASGLRGYALKGCLAKKARTGKESGG